jgi:predicted nucleic acid-binding protein
MTNYKLHPPVSTPSFSWQEARQKRKKAACRNQEAQMGDIQTLLPAVEKTLIASKRYALLRRELARKGQLIDQPDLFIAATAIQHNLTLVTRNRKDFARIPDLKLYQAS